MKDYKTNSNPIEGTGPGHTTKNRLDFLKLDYASVHFLINRQQIAASFLLEKSVVNEDSHESLFHTAEYNGQNLLLIDLDTYLKNVFFLPFERQANLALLFAKEDFLPHHQNIIHDFFLQEMNTHLNQNFIAIKISGEAKIIQLMLDELRLIPSLLQPFLEKQGILGLNFFQSSQIQFFIDLETILYNIVRNNIHRKVGQ